MSELRPVVQETRTAPEMDYSNPEVRHSQEQHNDEVLDKLPAIEEARATLLEQPDAPLELPLDDSPEGSQPQYIDRAMKAVSLKNELEAIRQRLPKGERVLSKVVHQPLVRKTSEVSAKTIARPLGLLGGGIFAFCGSTLYLLFAKYVGLRYNFSLFVIFFIIGYIVFLLAELISKKLPRRSR